jgi:hypothetical protein
MKILISSDGPHAHWYIRLGYAKAFLKAGHQVAMWDIGSKPAHDVFNEFEPDLFIGQTYNLNRALFNCIKARPNMKVIMKASDWGNMMYNIDLKEFPVLVANKEEIDLVDKLKKETGKPDFVDCHYHLNWIVKTHNFWRDQLNIPIVGLMSAADIFEFTGGLQKEKYRADIAFVGGRWGYKSRTLDKYIVRLCQPNRKYNIKIYGNTGWGVPQFCGMIPDGEVKHTLASATICPNISEPHSQVFGYDIVERPFKLLSNGCFCISDYVQSMAEDVFNNDEIVFVKSPDEFEEKVQYFLKNPDERLLYIERGQRIVMEKHTYFDRCAQILRELRMDKEAESMMNTKAACLQGPL